MSPIDVYNLATLPAAPRQVRVNCRVAGRPAPDVNWHVNGWRAVHYARHKMVVNESGFHTMLVSDARMSDAGAVRCVAKNRSGVAEFQVRKEDRAGGWIETQGCQAKP